MLQPTQDTKRRLILRPELLRQKEVILHGPCLESSRSQGHGAKQIQNSHNTVTPLQRTEAGPSRYQVEVPEGLRRKAGGLPQKQRAPETGRIRSKKAQARNFGRRRRFCYSCPRHAFCKRQYLTRGGACAVGSTRW